MRIPTYALLLLLLASPIYAAWNVNATTATWSATGVLSVVQEVQSAVIWQRDREVLLGVFTVMSQPSIIVTDNGDGTGTITMVMPRPQVDNWLQAWGVVNQQGGCVENPTNQQLLDCGDQAIREALRALTRQYRESQVAPPTEPDIE